MRCDGGLHLVLAHCQQRRMPAETCYTGFRIKEVHLYLASPLRPECRAHSPLGVCIPVKNIGAQALRTCFHISPLQTDALPEWSMSIYLLCRQLVQMRVHCRSVLVSLLPYRQTFTASWGMWQQECLTKQQAHPGLSTCIPGNTYMQATSSSTLCHRLAGMTDLPHASLSMIGRFCALVRALDQVCGYFIRHSTWK